MRQVEDFADVCGVGSSSKLAAGTEIPFYMCPVAKTCLKDMGETAVNVVGEECLDPFLSGITKEADGSYQPSPLFMGVPYACQADGDARLSSLHTQGLGGLLADEMGLGKTVQCALLLARLKEERERCAHAGVIGVIVCPKSVFYNWARELGRFVPSLEVVVVAGDSSRRQRLIRGTVGCGVDVLVTSYDSLVRDLKASGDICTQTVIFDEDQAFKNPESKRAGACRVLVELLSRRSRIALTGTPVENCMMDM